MTDLEAILRDIYTRHGALTPAIVVQEARPDSAPLHTAFEWDDSVAAEKYREVQASKLIRRVRIVYRPGDENDVARSVRGFVSTVHDDGGRTYKPIDDVAADPFARALLLREAERDWLALRRRYGHLSEFVELVSRDLGAA